MSNTDFLGSIRRRVLEEYGRAIGRELADVVTPALILDLPAARRNIALMAELISATPATIRPHVKVHKSPDLARLQVEHGAAGLSVATVWEASTMIEAGFDDIFLVNTITGEVTLRVLAQLARDRRVLIAVDDAANAEALASAATRAGSTISVLIEIDTGMDRGGVDTGEEALALARQLVGMRGLRFEGITGYEGHCSLIADRDERARQRHEAIAMFIDVAELLDTSGIPVEIRSAGGTATWELTARHPGVTEIQAGSYAVMDNFHRRMVPQFEIALTVAATVISKTRDRVIINAGSKAVADPDLATLRRYDLANVRFDEEHGVFALDGSAPHLAATVEVIPGYAPSTVNLFDAYHVVDDGVVIDIWPVVPRGPGHHGLAY